MEDITLQDVYENTAEAFTELGYSAYATEKGILVGQTLLDEIELKREAGNDRLMIVVGPRRHPRYVRQRANGTYKWAAVAKKLLCELPHPDLPFALNDPRFTVTVVKRPGIDEATVHMAMTYKGSTENVCKLRKALFDLGLL